MSRNIFFDIPISDVFVKHPYEPERCKDVMANILIFRHADYGSVYDAPLLILKYLYGEISKDSLYKDYGIFVLTLFHDTRLLASTFSICKEYFDYFECSDEYEYYLKKFVLSKLKKNEK